MIQRTLCAFVIGSSLFLALPRLVYAQSLPNELIPVSAETLHAVDADVPEATSSAILDGYLKEYLDVSSVLNVDTHTVLPLAPDLVKGISTYFSAHHLGIDIRADFGSPIRAIRDGVVVDNAYEGGGYGHYVVIEHTDGTNAIRSLYAHLSAENVKIGDQVKAKDVIGYIGLSGHTTGPHVHFETRICLAGQDYFNCLPMDPLRYLSQGLPSKLLAKK